MVFAVLPLYPFPTSATQWLNSVGNANKFALNGDAIFLQLSDEFRSDQVPCLFCLQRFESKRVFVSLPNLFRDAGPPLFIGGNATPALESGEPCLSASQCKKKSVIEFRKGVPLRVVAK